MSDEQKADTQALREQMIESIGSWPEFLDGIASLSPETVGIYVQFMCAQWGGTALDRKTKELLWIALNGSATRMNLPEMRLHIERALDFGATAEQIIETLQLTSAIGMHSCTLGIPVLAQELEAAGYKGETPILSARQEALKERFSYWAEFWQEMLIASPDFLESYLEFSSLPWMRGTLPPKVRELIYIAVDATTTHLYEPGLRLHIRNAMAHGATKQEIIEVLQLTTAVGMDSCTTGIRELFRVVEARNSKKSNAG